MKPDSEWIGQTLDRYEGRLLAYAFRITGDTESARDVVQETFLELCRANRARIDGHLAPWLYTVCRNRALNVRKKDGRMAVLSKQRADGLMSPAAPPSEVAESNEQHRIVRALVGKLPEREQEVFRLKFGDGLTYREISKVTGIPLSTISHIIHTAIKKLRDEIRALDGSSENAQGVEQ